MSGTLPDFKRRSLEQRRSELIQEYEAASGQLGRALSDSDRIRLQRQLDDLERQIQGIDAQLGQVQASSAVSEAKASPGSESQPDQLYGQGNRWAVLVGVNSYEDTGFFGPLKLCVKDVAAIREQLIAGGFDAERIRLLTDDADEKPNRANILTALQAVADATEKDDLLLFYYSGHGDVKDGESYLVAKDGRHLTLGDTAVSVTRVKEIMDAAPARAKVIILDACHSGADIGGKGPVPMSPEFIRRVFEEAEGMAILSSCKQGQLSWEWSEKDQGVFTYYMLEALSGAADRDEKGFVTVQDASRHVTNGVKLQSSQRNRSQIPTLQYTVAGDIILVNA